MPRETLECSYCIGGSAAIARVVDPVNGWSGSAACAFHLGEMIAAGEIVTDGLSQDVLDVVAETRAEYE